MNDRNEETFNPGLHIKYKTKQITEWMVNKASLDPAVTFQTPRSQEFSQWLIMDSLNAKSRGKYSVARLLSHELHVDINLNLL